jgi:thioredoxin-dependent peroxiredoxin
MGMAIMAQQSQTSQVMHIASGMRAPAFQTEDIFGRPISMEQFAGHPLLLSFYRNGWCALCNLRVHALIQRYPTYQRQGMMAIAVFESPRERILESVGKQDAPFPIIADPDSVLYARYGVELSEAKVQASAENPLVAEAVMEAAANGFILTPEEGSNFLRMPADFLIAPDQIIVEAKYADYVTDHLPFAVIEQYLAGWGCNGAD